MGSEGLASSGMLKAEYGRMAEVEAHMWWYTTLHACLLDAIRRVFPADRSIRILDAGCGTGGLLCYLRDRGYDNIVGLDIEDLAVEASRKQGLDVIQGSISDPAAIERAGRADVIVSMDVICSLPDDEQRVAFFRAAMRALNDPGLLIVQTPAFSSLAGIHDLAVGVNRRYTGSAMRQLLRQAGIEQYRLRYRLTLLTPLILLARGMQRLRLKFSGDVAIESDVRMPPRFINTLLSSLQRMEDRWLPLRPFGTSLQVLVTKGQQ